MSDTPEHLTIDTDEQPRRARPGKIPQLKPAFRDNGTVTEMGLAPMQAAALRPRLFLFLGYEVADGVYQVRRNELGELVKGLEPEPSSGAPVAGPTYGLNGFPLGVWGLPNDADADVKPLPSPEVIFAGNRIKVVSAASLDELVGPQIVYRQVESGRRPLPLSAAGPSRGDMLDLARGLGEVDIANAEQAVATARQVLFGPAVLDDSPRVTGRSRLARATYRGSRTAPPMFGTLTEGIDLSNPDGTTATTIETLPAGPKRKARNPRILGFVGAGSGRMQRIDQRSFAVRLHVVDRRTGGLGPAHEPAHDVIERRVAVDLGFTDAQEVEVRSVQNQNPGAVGCHLKRLDTPRRAGGDLRCAGD